ncbi:MAG: MotA/TolQ/ExbB proton channel family protein [Candidatus Omnitrophota bacterium]
MWPILCCSVTVFAIIIVKFRQLRSMRRANSLLLNAVSENIRHNRIKEGLEACEIPLAPIASILKAGILKFDRNRQEMKEAMENAARYEIPRLESYLPLLSAVSQLAPLLGMLGTVTGMIYCFHGIHSRAAALEPVYPAEIYAGIWQSLVSAMAGICTAVPAFIAYNYFVAAVNNQILEMEKAADNLVELLFD